MPAAVRSPISHRKLSRAEHRSNEVVLERLSEKWYEQHSERGFGRRREAKMGRKVPLRCSVRLHRRLLRPFSDSLRRGFL
jgi:hypothetical protein